MSEPLRILFAGTPDFAVPSLDAVHASGHELTAVYTQPDRPAGRGRKPRPGPVKQRALALGLPVVQPERLRTPEARAELAAWRPDLMVVVAYGLLLPRAVLEVPGLGCVNVHASLLPRWRGAAPIQRALLAGDAETGVSLMRMAAGLDSGDVYLRLPTPIAPGDTAGSLHDRLAALGAEGLSRLLPELAAARARAEPQDEAQVTYAAKIDKAEAEIDWSQPAEAVARRVRAFDPVPVAWTRLDGETVRLWAAHPLPAPAAAAPGTVVRADPEGIDVAAGDGTVRIIRLQWPGRRPLSAREAVNGRRLDGRRFG